MIWLILILFVATAVLAEGYQGCLNRAQTSRTSSLLLASSSYGETSGVVRGIVGGLTHVLNLLSGNEVGEAGRAEPRSRKLKRLNSKELVKGIRNDFEEGYLFSGKIETEIYDESCVFTDPTLSFKGLRTFEKNIESVEGVLDKFLGANLCVLYGLEKGKDGSVKTRWRMVGDIKLPWRPRLDLLGRTLFTPGGEEGRIVSYFEVWDETAGKALFQILRPQSKDIMPIAQLAQELKGEALNVHLCEEDGRRSNLR